MPKKPKVRKSPTPEVYQVEVITGARVNDDGAWEYHVKWAGYPEEDNSWEPHENVKECDRLLKDFWAHVGIDNDDYPLGYVVEAKQKWIKKEMAFFAAEFSQQKEVENHRRAKQSEKDATKKGNRKKNSGKTKKKPESSHDDSTSQSNDKGKAKQTTSAEELGNSNETLNSDGDKPLVITTKLAQTSDKPVPSKKRPRIVLSDDSDSVDPGPPRKSSKPNTSHRIQEAGPSTPTQVSTTQTEDIPASPTSLFSESLSPIQTKATLPKTSSKPQPKIKLMDIEPRSVASSSALSTKQRIIQKATSDSKANPEPPSKKPTLAALTFKKKLLLPSGSGSRTESQAKPVHEPLFSDINDISTSPTTYHSMQDDIPHSNTHQPQRDLPPLETRSPPPIPPMGSSHVADSDAAEEFLAQIFPRLDLPMMDVQEPTPELVSDEPAVPRSLVLPRPSLAPLPKIPKKWKWVGDLFIDTAPDRAEKICTVALSDATDVPQNGLRFSIIFTSVESIRIKKRLNVEELDTMLSACGPVLQLAKLRADNVHYEHTLNTVETFMDTHHQVGVIPLFLDDVEVASLVVFPSSLRDAWHRFKVPPNLQQTGTFLAALVPWTLTFAEYLSLDIQCSIAKFQNPEFKHPTSQAIRYLEFPDDLRTYMSLPQRTYCVWWSPADGTTAAPGLETNLLHSIMKSCRAKNVGHKADVRVVFVHIGAVKTLHKLPALAERRSKRPEIHFYTYGSHSSVPCEQWGVRAIYPLGGIVTFTPEALIENPIGANQLMRKLAEHPFWDCYLLPSVVGMATRSTCEGTDPLSEFKTGDLLLQNIITLMAEGEVSLLQAPPPYGDDPRLGWVSSQLRLFSLNASGLLEECLNAFAARYSNTSEVQLPDAIIAEISKDLLRMQTQPSIMENYRRFVVIKATGSSEADNKDGFEWTTFAKFDFKDDFFVKPVLT